MVDPAGDPSALESQIRQLGKALDDSRFPMLPAETALRSKTPPGPELDSSYRGYVSIQTSWSWHMPGNHSCVTKNGASVAWRLGEPSIYHAALDLMDMRVQSKALLAGCLLSRTGLRSDPLICRNHQPVPLHGEPSESLSWQATRCFGSRKRLGIFPNSANDFSDQGYPWSSRFQQVEVF